MFLFFDLSGMFGTSIMSAKIHSISGTNCEDVAPTNADLVSFQNYYPTGGVAKTNCAYLVHFTLEETSGEESGMAIQNFMIYYGYKNKYYASSAIYMIKTSIMTTIFFLSFCMW